MNPLLMHRIVDENVLGNPYFSSSHLNCISNTVCDIVFAPLYILLYGLSARTNKWLKPNSVSVSVHTATLQ